MLPTSLVFSLKGLFNFIKILQAVFDLSNLGHLFDFSTILSNLKSMLLPKNFPTQCVTTKRFSNYTFQLYVCCIRYAPLSMIIALLHCNSYSDCNESLLMWNKQARGSMVEVYVVPVCPTISGQFFDYIFWRQKKLSSSTYFSWPAWYPMTFSLISNTLNVCSTSEYKSVPRTTRTKIEIK